MGDFITLLYSVEIDTLTGSLSVKEKILASYYKYREFHKHS